MKVLYPSHVNVNASFPPILDGNIFYRAYRNYCESKPPIPKFVEWEQYREEPAMKQMIGPVIKEVDDLLFDTVKRNSYSSNGQIDIGSVFLLGRFPRAAAVDRLIQILEETIKKSPTKNHDWIVSTAKRAFGLLAREPGKDKLGKYTWIAEDHFDGSLAPLADPNILKAYLRTVSAQNEANDTAANRMMLTGAPDITAHLESVVHAWDIVDAEYAFTLFAKS